ncbi:uncharacterized protein LOC126909525, partial [Daktulosphaira vitifoliae]|uniref:uncharacterized protein LOC126909525 n=1 Tax=Daktulosphaira vitifoliae TaxID=58002 RepID=UPI0021A9EFA0
MTFSEKCQEQNDQEIVLTNKIISSHKDTIVTESINLPCGLVASNTEVETSLTGNYQCEINISRNSSVQTETLNTKLQKWVAKFNVSHNCTNSLLNILRSENLNLPKDARTLLHTPTAKEHTIVSVPPGSYIHIGVKFMLCKMLGVHMKCFNSNIVIELGINVDGVPLTSSSKSSFWPILISVVNIPHLSKFVLPVGIYHGKYKKPNSSFDLMNTFIIEINEIIKNGLTVGNKNFKFIIKHIVCDTPAKAFLLNVKGHNAYHGCSSCTVEGTFTNNRMAYLDMNANLRTDEMFRSKQDEFYHKDSSPLEDLPIDISKTVVLDYMHNICLGVTKKLLTFWTKGNKSVHLSNSDEVSAELINLKPFVPSEFSRLPRSLEEVEFWKAAEFRSFLLYFGPIVLKGRLKNHLYNHFMLLHCAVRLLINPEVCYSHNSLAKNLLYKFVEEYSGLYGQEYVGYNVHNLIHMTDFVLFHGELDTFSAFKYENYLQFLKKSCKNLRYPLQDIYNRIIEQVNTDTKCDPLNYPMLKNEIMSENPNESHYKKLILNNFIVSSTNIRDKYFILKNQELVEVNKIIKDLKGQISIVVTPLNYSAMYQNPLSSYLIKTFCSYNGQHL